jgi:SAM-dependent methyltransferase
LTETIIDKTLFLQQRKPTKDMVKEFWDQRYSSEEYAYGTAPNLFFKSFIDTHLPGKILLPGEGEGRNAVYAAMKGWEVFAIDQSKEGMWKAKRLADQNNVTINYMVQNLTDIHNKEDKFDAIALIFVHFPSEIRGIIHHNMTSLLNPGGWIIMESFSKKQLGRNSGGPPDIDMLYDKQDLRKDFESLEISDLYEKLENFNEGPYHKGVGAVVRMMARKST